MTTKYLNQEQQTDIESNLNNDTEISIDTYIDNCLDKQGTLNEQITNAELGRRIKVSPTTILKWTNQKSQPPKNLEWEYDRNLKKWVK